MGARSWLAGLALLLMGPTCGSDIGEKTVGEPCTRSSECDGPLVCVGGMCTAQSDAARDAGPEDGASSEGAVLSDGSTDGG